MNLNLAPAGFKGKTPDVCQIGDVVGAAAGLQGPQADRGRAKTMTLVSQATCRGIFLRVLLV